MIAREDFFNHFLPTVEKYYSNVLGIQVSFTITKNRNECNMVIKPKLSAVSGVFISKKAREFFYSEWNIRGSLVKHVIAKVYIFFVTRTGPYFAQYMFHICPDIVNLEDTIIAPNNRSIRFFDYGSDIVGCMIKDGFSNKYFRNQIWFRENYKYDFILPLLDYGTNWFREPIMHGHPLARITDDNLYNASKKKTIDCLRLLAIDTFEYIDSIMYIDSLCHKIIVLLEQATTKKKIKTSNESKKILNFAVKQANNYQNAIPTMISHGDLQTGNIWVDQTEKVWIYDWETADRRSVWYDVTVLEYAVRRNNGWRDLMSIDFPEAMNLLEPKKQKENNFNAMKGIVLLEDLCFYLEDLVELPERWGVEIYDSYIMRLMDIESIRNG